MGLGVISWFNRKKSCVALSTVEADYVASCSSSCEAVWTIRQTVDDDVKKGQLETTLQGHALDWCMKFLQVPTGNLAKTLALFFVSSTGLEP